jgi:dihydroorotase
MPYELAVHQLLVRPSTADSNPYYFPTLLSLCYSSSKHMDTTGTITAHHLYLTGDNSQTDPLAFCKPIPKKPSDRDALIKAVCSGDPKFFL